MSIDAFSVSAFNGPALWLLGMFGLEGGTRRGLEFLEWCALTNRRICWVAFFSSSSFFFLFSFRRGVTGNFLEMGFTSGLTSRVKYLSKLFSWNRFFFFLRRSSDYYSFVFFGFSDKVIT